MSARLATEQIIACYRRGVFPMADDKDDPRLFLVDPDLRGVIPLDAFHVSKSLRKFVLRTSLRVTIDTAFSLVVEKCAETTEQRAQTWINTPILNIYSALHKEGKAHSVECWDGENLMGGLYGVSLGAAFFGESMFSRQTNASKLALVHLVARLKAGGYQLLDTQFKTEHLAHFGCQEVPRDEFHVLLKKALAQEGRYHALGSKGHSLTGDEAMHLITQTS